MVHSHRKPSSGSLANGRDGFGPFPFADRSQAGHRLAQALENHRGADLLVVSLSGGGALIAIEISKSLHGPLDFLLMRKVRCPLRPDLAVAFVVDGPALGIFRDDDVLASTGLSEGQFWDACQFEAAELRHDRERYLGDRQSLDAKGRVLILVDDGAATGHMMRAALRILRTRDPRRIVVAVPVVSMALLEEMGDADEIVYLTLHAGPCPTLHHSEHGSVSREEVVAALAAAT